MSLQPVDLLTDGHVHTRLCNHASGEMEEYVLAAIDRGLSRIVFLEHMETGINYYKKSWLSDDDFSFYITEGSRLAVVYSDRITIELGVELGYNKNRITEIYQRLRMFDWARIGLSCHFIPLDDGGENHVNLLSRDKVNTQRIIKQGAHSVLATYLQALTEAVNTLPGTVLCHLDAALRNIPGITFSSHHMAQIDELLDTVKEKEMALEVNTSGFSMRGEPFPEKSILKRALDRGIVLTVGSDAHSPAGVGRDFDKVEAYIREAASLGR